MNVMQTIKTALKLRFFGTIVRTQEAAYGVLREYSSGRVTFTDYETGTETVVPPDALRGMRRWTAVATQGGGQFDVPEMSPEDAAQHVGKVGGTVVYQDAAAGLIFYKAK